MSNDTDSAYRFDLNTMRVYGEHSETVGDLTRRYVKRRVIHLISRAQGALYSSGRAATYAGWFFANGEWDDAVEYARIADEFAREYAKLAAMVAATRVPL